MRRIYSGYIKPGREDIELTEKRNPKGYLYSYTPLFEAIQESFGYDHFSDSCYFWGNKTEIDNVKMYAYYTDTECSLENAQKAMDAYMFAGELYISIAFNGYSEWTITGYSVENAMLGGHDLYEEIISHRGEYINMIVEVDE